MKKVYKGNLRCDTCGYTDSFEFNEDKSYIKCNKCGREYLGGYEELLKYNQEPIEQIKAQIKDDVEVYIKQSLQNALKGSKHLKIK